MKNSKGFSIVETIVVMALLAILSAIAVPSLIANATMPISGMRLA